MKMCTMKFFTINFPFHVPYSIKDVLVLAAKGGHTDLVKMLIAHGSVDLNWQETVSRHFQVLLKLRLFGVMEILLCFIFYFFYCRGQATPLSLLLAKTTMRKQLDCS